MQHLCNIFGYFFLTFIVDTGGGTGSSLNARRGPGTDATEIVIGGGPA